MGFWPGNLMGSAHEQFASKEMAKKLKLLMLLIFFQICVVTMCFAAKFTGGILYVACSLLTSF